ncbi:MAG: hypothetical protein K2I71_06780, partial [Helicobacter sp.]|nr:hypothetical protein [Helicobacter sp.]
LIANHLNRLFKKNSKAIALLFKALIKGEKLYPKDTLLKPIKEKTSKTLHTNKESPSKLLNPQTNSKPLKQTPTKSPLNIEG